LKNGTCLLTSTNSARNPKTFNFCHEFSRAELW
jgi:hypothetical protein